MRTSDEQLPLQRQPCAARPAAAGCCSLRRSSAASAALPGAWIEPAVEASGAGVLGSLAGWVLLGTRGLAGVGVGGLYTLAAALEARRTGGLVEVGIASMGLSLGSLLEYALAYLLLLVCGPDNLEFQWRLTFAGGGLLALATAAALSGAGARVQPARPPAASR